MMEQLGLALEAPREQLGIVLGPPRARRKDPSTSHEAAMRAVSRAPVHCSMIFDALVNPGTIYELAARTGLTHVQIARRLPNLKDAGLAKPTEVKRDGCRVWERT